jgi:heme exporter protein B
MSTVKAIVQRDLLCALRSGGAWLHGLIFFGVFLSIAAISLGGSPQTIKTIAPALIWLSLIFSLLLSFEQLFQTDFDDGSLEQMKLSNVSLYSYVTAKCFAHWILSILPLLVFLPIASIVFGLSIQVFAGLFFGVLIASPALICYGAFSSACLVGYKGGGILLVLLTIPLLVPVLIFGLSGGIRYELNGLASLEFQALAGLSLIAMAVCIPAATAALNSTME